MRKNTNKLQLNKEYDSNYVKEFILIVLAVILFVFAACSQNVTNSNHKDYITKWTHEPFEQSVFIENKGQFDGQNNVRGSKIKYFVGKDGVEIFFTNKGVIYRDDERGRVSKEECEEAEKEGKEMDRIRGKKLSYYITMQWMGANPNAEIIPEDETSNYYSYPDVRNKKGNRSIQASAYKKILYKNLYPGIDVEYFFPKNKTGIEYSLILHPGADISVVKMRYTGDAKNLFLNDDANISIITPFGAITDHKPIAYYKQGLRLASKFNVNENVVSFTLSEPYDHKRTIIIDPWTQTPPTSGTTNKVYDLQYDLQGNVYVYGGMTNVSTLGTYYYQESKYTSTGTLKWTYTATVFTTTDIYGCFCVDGHTGTSYICEGFNPNTGCQVIKVNTYGKQKGLFPGNPDLWEMWRCVYNNCTNTAVIAGGGTSFPYQAAMLDTNVSTMTPANIYPGNTDVGHDQCLLAVDNSNYAYMASVKSTAGNSALYDNVLIKMPMPALAPPAWSVSDGYNFVELGSITYNATVTSNGDPIGFNGIAVNATNLYTYDGQTLKQWNPSTGALKKSAIAGATPFSWGGVAVDECDNVYVGSNDSIKLYDVNLNNVGNIIAANTIYDVRLGPNNVLYACGNGFVSAIQLSGPPCTLLSLSINASTACGPASGQATVNVSGGSAPYTYSWSNGQTTQTITGLTAGTYYVTVTDNSCVPFSQKDSVVINTATLPTVTISSTNPACNGGSDGSATVTASGTGPFTYAWSPSGGTSATANNLGAGTYACTITDSNGCKAVDSVVISQPAAITVSVTNTTPAACGSSNGTATVSASGGTGALLYNWAPSGGTNTTASNLAAGTYTCTITDSKGCTKNITTVINNSGGPTVSFSGQNNILCNGDSSGSVTVNVSGGASPYSYSWSPSGGNNPTATNLAVGTYTCTVTDNNGCITNDTVTITQPSAILINSSVNNASCGNANGSISVNVSGGMPGYSYLWSPSGGSNATASNLAAGTYTCTVTDNNGCTQKSAATIINNGGPSVTTVKNNPTCNASSNGSATVTASGSGPFAYSWSPSGGSNATANNLAAGTYTCTITDNNGCITNDTVIITQPPAIVANVTNTTNAGCGASNGSATVSASGGTGTLAYSWSPSGGTNATANNLSSGTYTCTVTDSNGCNTTTTASITNPGGPALTYTQTNVSCNGLNNGSAAVSATGTGPYTYAWSPSGGNNATANNLAAGTYTVTVADNNGCISTDTITLTQPAAITATTNITDAACGNANGSATVAVSGGTPGYSYIWSPSGGSNANATNLAAGTYTCTITDNNNCTQTVTAIINNSGGPTVTSTQTNLKCNGDKSGSITLSISSGTGPFTYLWSPAGGSGATASNLAAGTYTCTITDNNGCSSTDTVTITQPSVITLNASSSNAMCGNPGNAAANASGGTSPYTYSWSSGAIGDTASNLMPGTYTVTVTDNNGCIQNQAITVAGSPAPSISISPAVTINSGESTTLTASGGANYQWSPSDGLSCTNCPDPAASPAQTTTYCVFVTDSNGCKGNSCTTVSVREGCGDIFVPNAFSPNNDDRDETECVYGGCIKTLDFVIYDRWGNKVFETTDQEHCWDGRYKGVFMNSGVFFYYLQATLNNDKTITRKGNISLIR